jgi:hypothetical protein
VLGMCSALMMCEEVLVRVSEMRGKKWRSWYSTSEECE